MPALQRVVMFLIQSSCVRVWKVGLSARALPTDYGRTSQANYIGLMR